MHESTANNLPGFDKNLFKSPIGYAYGQFDECLEVRAPSFQGQYCSVFYTPIVQKINETDPAEPLKETLTPLNSQWIDFYNLLNFLWGLRGRKNITPAVREGGLNYIPLGYPQGMGFCIPSSCSAEDLGNAVGQLIGTSGYINNGTQESIATLYNEKYCFTDTKDPPQFDGVDIAVL